MKLRTRRMIGLLLLCVGLGVLLYQQATVQTLISPSSTTTNTASTVEVPRTPSVTPTATATALSVLDTLAVKGRAAKTGYARTQFGNGWSRSGQCDMRNIILNRDLTGVVLSNCKVTSGILIDPYSGTSIAFTRGATTSDAVEIDHVVALSNAWQTGAQQLTAERRSTLANDPLELIAVGHDANQAKGDGDAASWLPANKAFRCQYVARQIAVKAKYALWVTQSEKEAMQRVLASCPDQVSPA